MSTGCPVPDLMVTQPFQAAEGDPAPALLSLATDVLPSIEAGRPLIADVPSASTPSKDNDLKGAYWVSPPLSEPVDVLGDGRLSLYARTWSGEDGYVRLCGALYEVPTGIDNPIASAPVEFGRIDETVSFRGTVQPTTVTWDLDLGNSRHIVAGRRIGLRIWVASDAPDDLVVVYDHPDNQSALTVMIEKEE